MRTLFHGYGGDPEVVLTGLYESKTQATDPPSFEGYAVYQGRVYQWHAHATHGGYYVTFPGTPRPEYAGATFNLGLEVATGLKGAVYY